MTDDLGSLIRAMSNSAQDHPLPTLSESRKTSLWMLNASLIEVWNSGEEISHCTVIHSECCSPIFIRATDGTTKTEQVCCYKCLGHEQSLVSVEKWASYVLCQMD